MNKINRIISKEDAQKFLSKIDVEGFDYAIENYSPKNTGDQKFEEILKDYLSALSVMKKYLSEIKDKYGLDGPDFE